MAIIDGTGGSDALSGTSGDDTINGLEGNDSIEGLGGNDVLNGGDGSDSLSGGAGNDVLDGGTGDDVMGGGAGDDTYYVDSQSDTPIENASAGTDTIIATFNWTLAANFENLQLRPQATRGTGNASDNIISGNIGPDTLSGLGGSDTLIGYSGSDILIGGGGIDHMDGGAGNDTYLIEVGADHSAAEIADSSPAGSLDRIEFASTTLGDTLTLYAGDTGVERVDIGTGPATDTTALNVDAAELLNRIGIFGNDGANSIAGSAFDDHLEGGAGDDELIGNGGNDIIVGGAGVDRMVGGQGDDTYYVQSEDTVIETSGEGSDTVVVDFVYTAEADIENVTILGSAGSISAFGNAVDNVLTGNLYNNELFGYEGNDRLNGRAGNDRMVGGQGDDVYIVDSAGDVVVENAHEGVDTVESSISFELPDYVNNLTLTGIGANYGYGNTAANTIVGNSASNLLRGYSGSDVLDGGVGADTMRGGTGNDTYYVDNLFDKAIENAGEGTDSVFSSLNFTLSGNIENLTIAGTAVRASGNGLANSLTGNSVNNILNGGVGADTMIGGAGDDSYYIDDVGDTVVENSGEGRDRVYSSVTYTLGDNADDLFLRGSSAINATGNGIDNTLRGNSAANVLTGGAGADDYRGGTGGDTFVFSNGDFAGLTPSTSDRIIDFSHAEGDHINLAGVDANSASGGDQAFAFIGTGAFSHTAGELRYEITNGNTYLTGDTDGDGLADFMVRLDGSHALVGGDFVL